MSSATPSSTCEQARLDAEQAAQRITDAEAELDSVRHQGEEGTKAVTAAEDALKRAKDNQLASVREQQKAEGDLRTARAGDPDFAGKVADAEQKVADARNNVKQAQDGQVTATLALKKATEDEATALLNSGQSAKDLNAYVDSLVAKYPALARLLGDIRATIGVATAGQIVDDGYTTRFGQPRATGGRVWAGRAYTVGERGPEPFVPDTNGRIIPTGSAGAAAGGGSVTVNVNVNGGLIEQRTIDQMAPMILTALRREAEARQPAVNGVRYTTEVAFATDPFAATTTWTDVSDYAHVDRDLSTRFGRNLETDTFSAGTLSLTLDNWDRRFDPTNAAGPYYGLLLPMRRIRVSAQHNLLDLVSSAWNSTAGPPANRGFWGPASGQVTASPIEGYGSGGSAGGAAQSFTTPASAATGWIPCAPGDVFVSTCEARRGAAGDKIMMGVKFANAAGTVIADTATPPQPGRGATTLTASAVRYDSPVAIAPQGAAWVAPGVYVEQIVFGGPLIIFDKVGLYNEEAVPSQWTAGGPVPIFTGYVEQFPLTWDDPEIGYVEVSAADGFKALNLADVTSTTYRDAVVARTPTVYYRFGDATGSDVARDYTVNARHAPWLGATATATSDRPHR